MTREEIITSMCYSYRHDYGIESYGFLDSGMTKEEREYVWDLMAQIFDHNIAPYMEFKK
jgi:hypothetical protein